MSHIISPFYTWPTVFTGKLPLKDKLGILQLKPLFKIVSDETTETENSVKKTILTILFHQKRS